MKNPQVLNINGTSLDSVLAFDGDNVIDDTDQETIGIDKGISTIYVNVYLYDLMPFSPIVSVENVTMTYSAEVDFWIISVNDIKSVLIDRHKYVGLIIEYPTSDPLINMRQFKIKEFCVDNDSFEDTWMHLPYQVEVGATTMIRWYGAEDFSGDPLFEAPAYQGGTGLVYATSAANVTHRGAIVPYTPV